MADHENIDILHESHEVFKREQDEQLVQWMNRFFGAIFFGVGWRNLLINNIPFLNM